MNQLFELWQQYEMLFWWLATVSFIMLFISLFVIPWLIIKLPADYLSNENSTFSVLTAEHPVIKFVIRLMKNMAGLVFLLAGILMLIVPGQGLLTIIVGLILLDYPGKRAFIYALLRKPYIIRPVNRIRTVLGKEPFR